MNAFRRTYREAVRVQAMVQLVGRLERNGLQARDRIVVTTLDDSECHALGEMLGRVLASDTYRVDL